MSRFWARILCFQPRFEGSADQRRKNLESHSWHNFRYEDVYSEAAEALPPLITCRYCNAFAESNAATWFCGEAPAAIPYSDLPKREKPVS